MFLVALGAEVLASLEGAECFTKGCGEHLKESPTQRLSREAKHHEFGTRIKNSFTALHRQVDTQDFVFTERETIPARAVTSPPRNGLSANANQVSS